MVKFLISFIVVIALSGCGTKEVIRYRVKVQEVKIPVKECPVVDEFIRPELELNNIDVTNMKEVFRAYPITIIQLKDYSKKLEKIIERISGK